MNKGIAVMLASSLLLSSCANRQETKVIKPINHNVTNFPLISFKKFEDVSNKLQKEVHKQEVKKDKGYIYEFDGIITAYTNSLSDTGKESGDGDYGVTASGTIATEGRTISMDKSIPYDSIVEIDGLGTFICEDRGSAIRGSKVDLFLKSSRQVDKFGKQHRKVKIIKLGDGKRHDAKNND